MKKIVSSIITLSLLIITASAHPGRTDAMGGHNVNTDGWGYPVGTYHYHDKNGSIVPVDKETGIPTGVTVIVKGETIFFDQPPVIIDGRTLVPVRYVVEKLGCKVEWNEHNQTVYIKTDEISNKIFADDGIKVVVDNELIGFDVNPTIINGRTLIPIRAVVEKLGYTVEWEPTLAIVYIN